VSCASVALAVFVVLALVPVLTPENKEFWITQANYIGLYTLVVFGLVLLTGVAGLTSFGQAAFVGLGAYSAAYLTLTYGVSPWLTVWIGLAFTAVASLVLAWVTLRMSGHYLPLATIAWGLSLFYLLGNLDFLGKYDGLLGIPALNFFGKPLNTGRSFFYLLWTIVVLAAIAMTHLLDSRAGRAMRAVKGGSTMAEAMGVDTFRVKVTAFVLAALLASVSGLALRALPAHRQPVAVRPEHGHRVPVHGGARRHRPRLGRARRRRRGADPEGPAQVLLPKLMGTSGNYEIIVFGVLLVLMLQYARDGLWSFVDSLLPRQRRKVDWADAPPCRRASARRTARWCSTCATRARSSAAWSR
jgi:branched-chain amino acid transport system permease protein